MSKQRSVKLSPSEVKLKLHPRNKHRGRYDFAELTAACPDLTQFVAINKYGDESIDFSDPEAVKTLNRALLKHFYGVGNWDIPPSYLCPPIPGRADYIHHIADLLAKYNDGKVPTGKQITCLDIGVGANCVYPIIGHVEYGWSFIGADIDPVSIECAAKIIETNPVVKGAAEFRLQNKTDEIFRNIIRPDEFIDLTICNPPFHSSLEAAKVGTLRKLSNLNKRRITKPTLNFGGQDRELWCEGGEERFIGNIIRESKEFWSSCFWFSSNISKQSSLKSVFSALKKVSPVEVKTIPMGQGNKVSRLVAWTYLDEKQQKVWRDLRWNRRQG